MQITRRDLIRTTLGAASMAALPMRAATRINSKINGVQIGAITYSFNTLAKPDPEAIVEAYVLIGLGEAELMSNHCEALAGAPQTLSFATRPGEVTDAPAQRKAAQEKLAEWRTTTSPDTWKGVRKKFNDAGVQVELLCYNMQDRMTDQEIEYGFQMAEALGVKAITTSTTLTMAKRIA